ncbi:DUF2252 domain-containing protein [Roseomonas sp. CECT 9278]|uniref:DUF2252 domain-containing protein n=1 Tax=Roseomonas sp. CECT 9278 TaxID=2845823 RepID=UPI001E575412|nr:DUF2252 domain-containing protein [Roseomonas sp. CECT 9278]CAH0216887.1 hypothetical protein ROS9278_02307 [Roseomonas sp. CECT 9278]
MQKSAKARPSRHGAPAVAAPAAPPPKATAVHGASLDERFAAGKALRDAVPRSSQAPWKRPADRPDPIALLQQSDPDRLPELVPIRYGRMLQSPFAFYRGSAAIMASDLAKSPSTGLRVQACGDCHLMNFGGFASPERNVLFDINDFDETLPAPWEWDVKRLVASMVLAARANGLSDKDGRAAAVAASRSYRKRLRDFAGMQPLDVWYARITAEDVAEAAPPEVADRLRARVAKAMDGSSSEYDFPRLAGVVGGRTTIRDAPPLIFHPDIARTPEFNDTLDQVFAAYRATLSDDRRVLLDRYRIVDAAIKVVGVGSVGRRCWIVLMMSAANEPLFLQVKEAVPSVLEPHAGASAYAHHGQRVVMGQRLMQPASDLFLGWVTAPNGRQFYFRQLRDAKIKPLVETFDDAMMETYGKLCGWSLARAHARSAEVAGIAGYLGSGDQFDEAMGDFALAYADQAERDHAALKAAVRKGSVAVTTDA